MTPAQKAEQREQIAACLNIAPADVAAAGNTLGCWFDACEQSGATVYWGLWAPADLSETL